MTRNSLESLEFEKRVKTLLTSLLATGKFKKKILRREPNQHHPPSETNQEVWRNLKDIREKIHPRVEKISKKNFAAVKKWIKKKLRKRLKMDQTETLDYTDEYTAHLIGLELSFNLDR